MTRARVAVLGIFAADLTFRAARLPKLGETLLADGFSLGSGGKGSNQAIAAAKAGAHATLITRIGDDAFGQMARDEWTGAGVDATHVIVSPDEPTGAAFIFVDARDGQNAIVVNGGAAAALSAADVTAARGAIGRAAVVVAQLEQPLAAATAAFELARAAGVATLLNPAPAAPLDDAVFRLCDIVTPNESEAELLTGITVDGEDAARRAADRLLARGAGAVLLTLGEKGALLHRPGQSLLVPAFDAGPVVETTGAGDAFTGAFAVALAEGRDLAEAARFGCAAAGISVTRPGAGRSMPLRAEIDALLSA
ncbi:ribokinase [Methylopila henanensis]|uniref:Ribokinase n=1 Tax=Methylopila henanensis TaxID=873516 RepID=A0ABW4K2S6_9HYPH